MNLRSTAAPGCSGPLGSLGTAAFALAANDFLLHHTQKYILLTIHCKAFSLSSHAQCWLWGDLYCRLQSSWAAVFPLSPSFFFPPHFPWHFFFGTLTFQLQAKQPLLFFSLFSRITSSETLWHFKNRSVYLCYLYKASPLTTGFLFGLKSRLPRVWWYPPLAPTSSLCFVAKRCCLIMFELHRGSLLQKELSHFLPGWIQHPLNIESE